MYSATDAGRLSTSSDGYHPTFDQHSASADRAPNAPESSNPALSGLSDTKGKNKAPDVPPPRYDEVYRGDGKFEMPNGKAKFMSTNEARREYMTTHRMNTRFIDPDSEAGVVSNKKCIFVGDDSGSMNERSTRVISTTIEKPAKFLGFKTGKTKTKTKTATITESRLEEQQATLLSLMRTTETFSAEVPSLWTLNGVHLEGDAVYSTSPEVREALSHTRGGTPLTGTLRQVRAYESQTGDTSDISLFISTDGDPTDAGAEYESRKMFHEMLTDLTANGVSTETAEGTHTRKVRISLQYIGDDDKPFKYKKSYRDPITGNQVSRATDRERYYELRIDDVARNGSTGAWLNALDNARKGGVEGFDVMDDDHSERGQIERATGMKISDKDLSLKRVAAPWVRRLDGLDESSDSE